MKRQIGRTGDWWLAAGVLLLAAALLAGLWLWSDVGQHVEVTVAGEKVLVLPLSINTTVLVPGIEPEENRLVIQDGTAHMESATCPDGLCVSHRPISRAGESIICLPHKVVITVTGGRQMVDGATQ